MGFTNICIQTNAFMRVVLLITHGTNNFHSEKAVEGAWYLTQNLFIQPQNYIKK